MCKGLVLKNCSHSQKVLPILPAPTNSFFNPTCDYRKSDQSHPLMQKVWLIPHTLTKNLTNPSHSRRKLYQSFPLLKNVRPILPTNAELFIQSHPLPQKVLSISLVEILTNPSGFCRKFHQFCPFSQRVWLILLGPTEGLIKPICSQIKFDQSRQIPHRVLPIPLTYTASLINPAQRCRRFQSHPAWSNKRGLSLSGNSCYFSVGSLLVRVHTCGMTWPVGHGLV